MTQDCSLPSSTAQSDAAPRRSLQGIHIIGTDEKSASKVEGVSSCEEQAPPWGYLFMQHMVVEKFQKLISSNRIVGDFHPPCFIHRTVSYKRKPSGKGVMKEEKPTVSGLVFLQGTTAELRTFLSQNFPQYHLVRNCATGLPASIPHSVMKPFMRLMDTEPERVTFLRPLPQVRQGPRQTPCPHRPLQRSGRLCSPCQPRPPARHGSRRLRRSHQPRPPRRF